ncbi:MULTISPECIES: hypothetical protein [Niastella]|uniref:Cytochrome c domain-containing protein n=1 Tax=Niastella soli TaxID=2821487 RepID=A0ABS3YXG1_9BACT|nr:hypothetical protein [Niastella soli]MBO9202611.1 hypothetical protein [Niastella soli]
MKSLFFPLSLIILAACNHPKNDVKQLQEQIDSLQNKLDNSYKPGFGEFMSSIQMHHAKLWFAGTNNNWKLADFEVHEIQEALEAIQQFNTDRPEAKEIGMINPAIDSVNSAIKQLNQQLFRSSYILLTNTCNNCHRATQHEFNVITIPANPPISNQNFKPVD